MAHRRTTSKRSQADATAEIYRQVTDRMVALLETNTVPWHCYTPRELWAQNMGGRQYRGVNSLMLHPVIAGYTDPRWATFRQVEAAGGSVRKGERSSTAIFWKWLRKQDRDDAGEMTSKRIPLLRRFAVFNIEQTTLQLDPIGNEPREHTPEEETESIVGAFIAAGGPKLEHSRGSLACYNSRLDRVHMPNPETCVSGSAYYSTLLHELAHSTGAETRLNRDGITKSAAFGTPAYAEEELIAELGACFVRAATGMQHEGEQVNSAAYCQGWMKRLRDDPKLFVRAAGKAQRAADLILGVTWEDRDAAQDDDQAKATSSTPASKIEYKGLPATASARPTTRPAATVRPLQTDPAPTLFG